MENVSLISAFLAGLLSFISPCVLPLVPAYISFISGVSLEELREGDSGGIRRNVILTSLLIHSRILDHFHFTGRVGYIRRSISLAEQDSL